MLRFKSFGAADDDALTKAVNQWIAEAEEIGSVEFLSQEASSTGNKYNVYFHLTVFIEITPRSK